MKKDNLTELEFVVFTNYQTWEYQLAKGLFDLKKVVGVEQHLPALGEIDEKCTRVTFFEFKDGLKDVYFHRIINLPYAEFKALREKEIA